VRPSKLGIIGLGAIGGSLALQRNGPASPPPSAGRPSPQSAWLPCGRARGAGRWRGAGARC